MALSPGTRLGLYEVTGQIGLGGTREMSRVETEVISAMTAVVKARDQPKVELWLGLDQKVPPTLQSVAEAAGVTRERIRQIVMGAHRWDNASVHAPRNLA